MLMPKVANGLELDWDLGRARAENLEVMFAPTMVRGRPATVRVLGYVNHANMGDYREATSRADSGHSVPVIEDTREQGRVKYGFGVGVEQPVSDTVRLFGRWGANEPHFESFAYTEVNDSATIGGDTAGAPWGRPIDRLGAALVTNGLSADHRRYLERGGRGFLLGDGALTYGRETILELYYNAHVWRGTFAGVDLQRIVNPGYNRDRGPVAVYGLRLHVEF
jgi:carbohydrate-selective porin OprB